MTGAAAEVAWLALCAASACTEQPKTPDQRQSGLPTAVEVAPPPATSSAESDSPETEEPVPSRGLAACVDGLRSGFGIDRGDEGRGPYESAYASERAGDYSAARGSYLELIQKTPRSRLVPLAYLAFGEMFAREAETDQTKWQLAQAAFHETLKYPPPDNPSYAYAQLRVGDANVALGRAPDALSSFMSSLRATLAHADAPCAEAIAARGKLRLVDAYAVAGRPERAASFFRAAAVGDDGTVRDLLAELAAAYFERGASAEGCETLKAAALLRVDGAASLDSEPRNQRLAALERRCTP